MGLIAPYENRFLTAGTISHIREITHRGVMVKSEFTEFELNEIKKNNHESEEYEQLIKDVIEELDLKSKSREYLEHEVARLRLELKRVEDEPQLAFSIASGLLNLGFKTTGIFARVSKILGSVRKNAKSREKKNAIEKAKRLWKAALESGELMPRNKEGFIEKIQKENPDIAVVSFEHLSKTVLKYPKK